MRNCKGCGTVVPWGSKFCGECGERFDPPVCCGNVVNSRFCGECGKRMDGATAPVSRAGAAAAAATEERKARFADLHRKLGAMKQKRLSSTDSGAFHDQKKRKVEKRDYIISCGLKEFRNGQWRLNKSVRVIRLNLNVDATHDEVVCRLIEELGVDPNENYVLVNIEDEEMAATGFSIGQYVADNRRYQGITRLYLGHHNADVLPPAPFPVQLPSARTSTVQSTTNTAHLTATITAHPAATITVPPAATNNANQAGTNTARPAATNTAHAAGTNTARAAATNTARPSVTITAPPSAANTAPPAAANTTHPSATITVLPAATNTARLAATIPVPPAATITPPPAETITAPPAVTITAPPAVTITAPPAVTNTARPAVTITVPPAVTNTGRQAATMPAMPAMPASAPVAAAITTTPAATITALPVAATITTLPAATLAAAALTAPSATTVTALPTAATDTTLPAAASATTLPVAASVTAPPLAGTVTDPSFVQIQLGDKEATITQLQDAYAYIAAEAAEVANRSEVFDLTEDMMYDHTRFMAVYAEAVQAQLYLNLCRSDRDILHTPYGPFLLIPIEGMREYDSILDQVEQNMVLQSPALEYFLHHVYTAEDGTVVYTTRGRVWSLEPSIVAEYESWKELVLKTLNL